MFAPRSIVKGKDKASHEAQDILESSVAAAEPEAGPSTPREKSVEPTLELTEDERDRQEDIHFEVEIALSDWGLSRFPRLVEAIRQDADGYVAISELLDCPALKLLDASERDIARCFSDTPSETVELHEDKQRLRRKMSVNETALAFSLQEWADMTLYVEGLPTTGRRRDTTPRSMRAFLSKLFGTSVQTVRFPPHHNRESSSRDRTASGDATLYESHPEWNALDKAARRAQKMPEDGGSFDSFAFIVLANKEATERVLQDWPFKRDAIIVEAKVNGHAKESSPSEGEEEVKKPRELTEKEQAQRSGLKMMTLADWNVLRASYLSYKRALQKLEDEYEEKSWRDQERRRDRDRYDRNNRRRDDAFWSSKPRSRYDDEEEEAAKPRPSDSDRWGHRSPTPDEALPKRVPGALVSLRHILSSAKAEAVKRALNALLAKERPDKGSVTFVDVVTGKTQASVHCSTVETAQALTQIFGGDPRTHNDPDAADADAFELMDPMDEMPIVKAVVCSEAEEQAYWVEAQKQGRIQQKQANGRRDTESERWGHRSATPEDAKGERVPGSLVSLRHINTSGRADAIKQALTALLASERPDSGSVSHVDLASGSIRATARCSSAEAAVALVEIFNGDPRTHSDAHGSDANAFELMDPMDESPMIKATVLSEVDEKAYWAEVSRHDANDANGRRPPTSSKKRGDRSDRPKSKHTRFN